MSSSKDSDQQLAAISALADGTLDPARRKEVEAQIAASPELKAIYERERRMVDVLHGARERDRAPAGLRARIQAQRPSRASMARRRISYGGAVAAALAAIILALVLVLPSGTPGSPTLSQAAAIALHGATDAPPPPDPTAPAVKLGLDVEDVYFPNWSQRFGWRAVGQRTDLLGGRSAVTVYYQRRGRRVAYTILGVPPLSQPAAQVTRLNGTVLRTLTMNGRLVVTWRRDGRTCVLSASGVPAGELQKLAAWQAPGLERS